jgi:hypothetical protein
VASTLLDRAESVHVLIRDHDREFTRSFDEVTSVARRLYSPYADPVPQANRIGERFVRTFGSLLAPHAPRACRGED